MSSFIAKKISKKILGETVANKFGQEDAYFETVPAKRLRGGQKMKKRWKAAPPGISKHDEAVLTKVKRRAYRFDLSLFNLCGIQFGWSSLVGLFPFVGDALDAFMALMVVHTAQKIEGGLPDSILSKMYLNVVIDFAVGLVPFLGDIADAVFKANTRNAVVLEEYLRDKGVANLKQSGVPESSINDPTDPRLWDDAETISPGAPSSQPSHAATTTGDRPQPASARRQSEGVTGDPAQLPRPAQPKGHSSSFFGFGKQRARSADEERGGNRA